MLRETVKSVRVNRDDRAGRDVVQAHLEVRRVGDGREVAVQALLARLRVIRRNHQKRVRARLGRGRGEFDGRCGVIGARAGDQLDGIAELRAHGAQQLQLLVGGRRRGFAGGAGENERIAAVVGQMPGQTHACIDVQGAVRVKRGHHGDGDGAEGIDASVRSESSGHCCKATCSMSRSRVSPRLILQMRTGSTRRRNRRGGG